MFSKRHYKFFFAVLTCLSVTAVYNVYRRPGSQDLVVEVEEPQASRLPHLNDTPHLPPLSSAVIDEILPPPIVPEIQDTRRLPPLFPEFHQAELALPQHNPDLPYPEGRTGKYIWLSGHTHGARHDPTFVALFF